MCDGCDTFDADFQGEGGETQRGKPRGAAGRPRGTRGRARYRTTDVYGAEVVSADESRRPGLRGFAEERSEHVVRLPDLLRSASGRHEREDLLRLAIVHGPPAVEPDVGQRGQRHVERDGHPVEAVDRNRLLAALDLADELPAEVRPVAESLLTETPLLTQGAQPLTEKASNLSGRS